MKQLHLPLIDMTVLERLAAERAVLKAGLFACNTVTSYKYDFGLFQRWAETHGRSALPASSETLSLYVTELLADGIKVVTARRRCCGVAHQHKLKGLPSPFDHEVRALLCGAQRLRAEKPRQMRPLTLDQLRHISSELRRKGTRQAIRDRAIIVLGFATALRRASIAALMLADVEFTGQGLIVHVQREKQDQLGRGRLIGVPRGKHPETCAVQCLATYIEQRGRAAGPLFLQSGPKRGGTGFDGEAILKAVKRGVGLIGLDPDDRWGGHSLRAGFITAAGEAGASEWMIAAQTGHRSMDVLRRYFRRTELFRANACAMLNL